MRRVFLTALLAFLAGCNQRTPSGPTAVPIPPNARTFIQGPSFVFFGAAADYRFMIEANGERTAITNVTWSVDDTRIARIDATGHLTPAAFGVTMIRAAFQDRQASTRVQIAPDIGGVWEGTARLTRCTGTFCDPRVCRNVMLTSGTVPISLRLTQRETEIAGQLGNVPLTGDTHESGTIALSGVLTQETGAGSVVSSVQNFVANVEGDLLRGAFTSISEGARHSFFTCTLRERLETDREFLELRRTSR